MCLSTGLIPEGAIGMLEENGSNENEILMENLHISAHTIYQDLALLLKLQIPLAIVSIYLRGDTKS
jgi:hypothetical protein